MNVASTFKSTSKILLTQHKFALNEENGHDEHGGDGRQKVPPPPTDETWFNITTAAATHYRVSAEECSYRWRHGENDFSAAVTFLNMYMPQNWPLCLLYFGIHFSDNKHSTPQKNNLKKTVLKKKLFVQIFRLSNIKQQKKVYLGWRTTISFESVINYKFI